MSSTKPLTSTNTESVLSQGTGCTSSILVTRSTLTSGNVQSANANTRRVHKTAISLALVAFLAGALTLAYGMHQRANAAPVNPTWQQPVVTIDDAHVVELAQQWGAPFRVEFAASGADITVGAQSHADMVGGEATKTVDGDRITGCAITAEDASDVVMLHELGHCFGLHHDNGASKSLMYWIQGGDSGAAGVTAHDRAALTALYEGTN